MRNFFYLLLQNSKIKFKKGFILFYEYDYDTKAIIYIFIKEFYQSCKSVSVYSKIRLLVQN